MGSLQEFRKDFDGWNTRKKELHVREFSDFVHEREVWWCAVGVNIGVEADGKHENYERPVLVVRKFNRESVLVVPLTTKLKQNPYYVIAAHGGIKFAAVISQIRYVSTKRLRRLIYRMDSGIFSTIFAAVQTQVFKCNRPPRERGPRRPHGHK